MINIKNLKVEKNYNEYNSFNVAGLSDRLVDKAKNCSILINTNSLNIDLIKSMLKYRKNIKYQWIKGKNTDSLFLRIYGKNHDIIALLKKYNTNLIGITYQEKKQLDYIRKNSYISKKYSLDDVTDIEYGVYEPINTIDTYIDYDNIKNQFIFHNKRINYEKIKKEDDKVGQHLKRCCKIITDFKLSIIDNKIKCFKHNKIDCIAIFNYMINKKEKTLKIHYKVIQEEKAIYNNYNEFIKCVVCYGASHLKNNRFWREIKRELY